MPIETFAQRTHNPTLSINRFVCLIPKQAKKASDSVDDNKHRVSFQQNSLLHKLCVIKTLSITKVSQRHKLSKNVYILYITQFPVIISTVTHCKNSVLLSTT